MNALIQFRVDKEASHTLCYNYAKRGSRRKVPKKRDRKH